MTFRLALGTAAVIALVVLVAAGVTQTWTLAFAGVVAIAQGPWQLRRGARP